MTWLVAREGRASGHRPTDRRSKRVATESGHTDADLTNDVCASFRWRIASDSFGQQPTGDPLVACGPCRASPQIIRQSLACQLKLLCPLSIRMVITGTCRRKAAKQETASIVAQLLATMAIGKISCNAQTPIALFIGSIRYISPINCFQGKCFYLHIFC